MTPVATTSASWLHYLVSKLNLEADVHLIPLQDNIVLSSYCLQHVSNLPRSRWRTAK